MFHNNDSKLVVNLDFQLGEKELAFMINKTLFIRCKSIKCDLSLDSVQNNIIALYYCFHKQFTFHRHFKRTNEHYSAILILVDN